MLLLHLKRFFAFLSFCFYSFINFSIFVAYETSYLNGWNEIATCRYKIWKVHFSSRFAGSDASSEWFCLQFYSIMKFFDMKHSNIPNLILDGCTFEIFSIFVKRFGGGDEDASSFFSFSDSRACKNSKWC